MHLFDRSALFLSFPNILSYLLCHFDCPLNPFLPLLCIATLLYSGNEITLVSEDLTSYSSLSLPDTVITVWEEALLSHNCVQRRYSTSYF